MMDLDKEISRWMAKSNSALARASKYSECGDAQRAVFYSGQAEKYEAVMLSIIAALEFEKAAKF